MKWGYVLIFIVACTQVAGPPKRKEFNWAIQGVYSQLDCKNQIGKKPYYVNVEGEDGKYHSYFLECR